MKMRNYFLSAALLLAMALGCGGGDDETSDPSSENETPPAAVKCVTPQAAFEAYKAANLAKDYGRILTLLTPESQQQRLQLEVSSALARAPRSAETATLLKKHGIDPDQLGIMQTTGLAEFVVPPGEMESLLAAVADKPALYADLSRQKDKAEGELTGVEDSGAGNGPQMTLANVQVNGNVAKGEQHVMIGEETLVMPIEFHKIDGQWYVHLVEE